MRKIILVIALSFSLTSLWASINQQGDPGQDRSIFDLVSYQAIQEVTIELDLNKLLSDRRSEESYRAKFSFKDQTGNIQDWKIKVNLRGRFRRVKCTEMPPLKLNFKKGQLAESGLALFDDFKLVTECVEDEAMAKELLLKEYLAYKIYNEITDYSFRVQFLKINFKDIVTGKTDQQWGFIIEDTAQLRARLKAEKVEQVFGIEESRVNKEQFKSMALFQYMIGNLDWDVLRKTHNVKLIEKDGQFLAIPYDFDFSGLVSAPYALLNPNYQVNKITDRYYLGNPEDLEEMNETVDLFNAKKENIIDMIRSFKFLKRDERREMVKYIETFYKSIDKIRLPEIATTNSSLSAE